MVTREQSTREIIDELVAQAVAGAWRRARPAAAPRRARGKTRLRSGGVMEPAAAVTGSRRVCCAACATRWRARAAAQQRLDQSSTSSPPRWSPRSARSTSCAPARCWSSSPPRACGPRPCTARGCASARVSSASSPRPRGPLALADAQIASRFRLPPRDRRGDLPLADGRAGAARRPRARRARRAEPHPAPLRRGRDRDAADHRHDPRRAGGDAASWSTRWSCGRPRASATCRSGSKASASMPASRSGAAVLHAPRIAIRQVVAEDPQAELARLRGAVAAMQQAIDAHARDQRRRRGRRARARSSRATACSPPTAAGCSASPRRCGAASPPRRRCRRCRTRPMRACRRRAIPICASGWPTSRT